MANIFVYLPYIKTNKMATQLNDDFLDSLRYQWSGDIQLHNGLTITIWWTAWAMRREKIKKVINVYSDLPKVRIK